MTRGEELTGRTRILEAFAHRKTDRVPVFEVANNPELYRLLLGEENPWCDGAPTVALARKLGLDAAMVPVGSYTALIKKERAWEDDTSFRDRFGVRYAVSESSWPLGMAVEEVRLDRDFLSRFESLATIKAEDVQPIVDAVEAAHTGDSDEIALFGGTRSAFSFLTVSGGLTAVSLLIYQDPELLHELVEVVTDYWTEVGCRLIEAGVDALYVANDMGMNAATLISPEHLREFFLPAFDRQCDAWKQAGGRVILHSCGNIEAILPDLAAIDGIDALNNLQSHAGMSLPRVKQQYGERWTLIGNVDATTVMTSERMEDIDEAIAEAIHAAAAGGGFILATDHSFHKGIPVPNVLHFIEQAKLQGRYPPGTADGTPTEEPSTP